MLEDFMHLLLHQNGLVFANAHSRWRRSAIVVAVIITMDPPYLRFGVCRLFTHCWWHVKDRLILHIVNPTLRIVNLKAIERFPCTDQTPGDGISPQMVRP